MLEGELAPLWRQALAEAEWVRQEVAPPPAHELMSQEPLVKVRTTSVPQGVEILDARRKLSALHGAIGRNIQIKKNYIANLTLD